MQSLQQEDYYDLPFPVSKKVGKKAMDTPVQPIPETKKEPWVCPDFVPYKMVKPQLLEYLHTSVLHMDRDAKQYKPDLMGYLRKYFPESKNFVIEMSTGCLKVYRRGDYSVLEIRANMVGYPSCCGWSIYHGFAGTHDLEHAASFMKLSKEQLQAFKSAAMMILHALLVCAGPCCQAVFIDCGLEKPLADFNTVKVNFPWALEAIMTCPRTNVRLLESRVNSNSQRMMHTVVFDRPTRGDVYAAWH